MIRSPYFLGMIANENKPRRKHTPRRDVHSEEAAESPNKRTGARPHEVENYNAEEKYSTWFTD
jgi:hypothetical protein